MTKKEAIQYVKLCARDKERAHKSGMEFRPVNPVALTDACKIVIDTVNAPKYLKVFAYNYLGGDYERGYLPEE